MGLGAAALGGLVGVGARAIGAGVIVSMGGLVAAGVIVMGGLVGVGARAIGAGVNIGVGGADATVTAAGGVTLAKKNGSRT
jgi:hypothetical protein